MPWYVVLPSESVFRFSPPFSCFPLELTLCNITDALRTGLPVSCFDTLMVISAYFSSAEAKIARNRTSRKKDKRFMDVIVSSNKGTGQQQRHTRVLTL